MSRAIKLTALLGVLLASLAAFHALRPGHAPGAAAANARPVYDADAIVVRVTSPAALDSAAAFALSHGYAVTASDPGLLAMSVALPAGTGVPTAIAAFTRAPGVLFAEPSYQLYTADAPADPLYGRQSSYLSRVHAPQAWDIEKGSAGVIVAVLDTGIDVGHPDLAGRIWVNPGEIANNALDDDADNCVDDVNGCSFVSDPAPGCGSVTDGLVNDDVGHGTFVAGVIAANGNSQGIVGVARGVTIMPVKVLDCAGSGTSLAVAQGIMYAAKKGATVINVSLGGQMDSAVLREAVRAATDEFGVLIVAASGNTGKEGVSYPARYDRVLAVGAASIGNPNVAAPFTTSGPEIDVVAIGENVLGTVPRTTCGDFLPCIGGQPYASGSGTSFSAPQVTGLAALILSRRPGTPPAVTHKLIKDTAHAVPAGKRPNWRGAGLIDMAAALEPQFRLGAPGTTRN